MADQTRQQRRREIRDQVKAGARHLASGIARQPGRETVLALARVVAEKLGEKDNAARASEAAALAHTLCERSLTREPPEPRLACRTGCTHCCYQLVGAVAPEVFRIARAVRAANRPGLDAASVLARGAPLKGVAARERLGRELACPLLVGDLCAVYAERPLVCRQTTSFDVAACLDERQGRALDRRIEVSPAHLDHAGSASVILIGAARAHRLDAAAYELSAALEIALREPDAEARWLTGERVLAAAGPPLERSRDVEFVADRIAEALAGAG